MSKAWLDLATIPVGFHYDSGTIPKRFWNDSGTIPLQCLRQISLKSPFNLREICLLHGIEHELGIARFHYDSAWIPLQFRNDFATIPLRCMRDISLKCA